MYDVEDPVAKCFSAILTVDVFIEWHQCVKLGGGGFGGLPFETKGTKKGVILKLCTKPLREY